MQEFKIHLVCPWCRKGESLADGRAKVQISIQCSKCNNIFIADLDTSKTSKAKPQKRQGRKK